MQLPLLVEFEIGNVSFLGEGKPEYAKKKHSEQGREPALSADNILPRAPFSLCFLRLDLSLSFARLCKALISSVICL